MTIESANNSILIKFPNDIKIDVLQDMIDWFQYNEIGVKSKAKQKDVDNLVSDIKKGSWERRRGILTK